MAVLIDTNIAIHLRDGDAATNDRLRSLDSLPLMSIVSRVELEGGVYSRPALAPQRRTALDILLRAIAVLPFEPPMVDTYGRIVAACGYSRPRILDRMIAATALVHDLTLVTINGDDFRDIPGLKLEVW